MSYLRMNSETDWRVQPQYIHNILNNTNIRCDTDLSELNLNVTILTMLHHHSEESDDHF